MLKSLFIWSSKILTEVSEVILLDSIAKCIQCISLLEIISSGIKKKNTNTFFYIKEYKKISNSNFYAICIIFFVLVYIFFVLMQNYVCEPFCFISLVSFCFVLLVYLCMDIVLGHCRRVTDWKMGYKKINLWIFSFICFKIFMRDNFCCWIWIIQKFIDVFCLFARFCKNNILLYSLFCIKFINMSWIIQMFDFEIFLINYWSKILWKEFFFLGNGDFERRFC